ncbi:MAG: protein translocase subunit SecD [Firmicutes bacterium]|nr:protein translocase subunit SecD [Bacillota bacterium]
MVRWGRLTTFLLLVVIVFALIFSTAPKLFSKIPLGLDLQGGIYVLYQIGNNGQHITSGDVTATVAALENRVNNLGVSEPDIEVVGSDRVSVSLAGKFNQAQAMQLLTEQANLEFRSTTGKVLATGQDIESNAHYEADSQTGGPDVAITFKNAQLFQDITTKYMGQNIVTWLNGKVINEARVDSVISGGSAVIQGMSSVASAVQLAKLLNAGALPEPLHTLSSTTVGPTLGQAALQETMFAGAVAIGLIFLFMLFMYRLPGLIAIISLLAYSYVLLAVFAGFPITLTLTGLAALVLGIGMAVDANIITYERVKDELRNGKSVQSAVIAGQRKALRTILDSNVTTFIAGVVMYAYGTGDVRGFAVALVSSIIVSLLTAVLLSRTLLILLTRSNVFKNPWLFGAKRKVVAS